MSEAPEGGPPAAGARSGRAEASRLGGVALLLAGSVLVSRLLGYARDLVLANQAGAGSETDAYFVAFLLPDLLNYLLAGGALSIAFIPVYSRIRETRGDEAAGRLFATVLGSLGLLAVVGTACLWLAAEDIGHAQLDGFDAETRSLAVHLARIMLPAQVFFVTGGILRAVLMAHGRFGAQAAAPLLYNGAVIACGLATGSVEGFAWGVLVGAALGNWLAPLIELRRIRSVRPRIAPFDVDFRRYLVVAAPLMLGLSLSTVDEWYEKFLGVALEVGSVSFLGYARKLMMVPVAVIGQALGAAALPVLANFYASRRYAELDHVLTNALRIGLGLGLLAAIGTCSLATPMVEFLLRQGRFDAAAAEVTAQLLFVMALGTPAWVVQQVAVRAFYAREDTWRPMLLGTGVALAVIPLYLLLREQRGAVGLAAAGVVAMSVNALATLAWARIRHGAPAFRPLLETVLRTLPVALLAGGAAELAQIGGTGRAGAALDLVLGGTAFVAVALAGVFAVGDVAIRNTLKRLGGSLAARLSIGRARSG